MSIFQIYLKFMCYFYFITLAMAGLWIIFLNMEPKQKSAPSQQEAQQNSGPHLSALPFLAGRSTWCEAQVWKSTYWYFFTCTIPQLGSALDIKLYSQKQDSPRKRAAGKTQKSKGTKIAFTQSADGTFLFHRKFSWGNTHTHKVKWSHAVSCEVTASCEHLPMWKTGSCVMPALGQWSDIITQLDKIPSSDDPCI